MLPLPLPASAARCGRTRWRLPVPASRAAYRRCRPAGTWRRSPKSRARWPGMSVRSRGCSCGARRRNAPTCRRSWRGCAGGTGAGGSQDLPAAHCEAGGRGAQRGQPLAPPAPQARTDAPTALLPVLTLTTLKPETIEKAQAVLTAHIGPIAKVMVRGRRRSRRSASNSSACSPTWPAKASIEISCSRSCRRSLELVRIEKEPRGPRLKTNGRRNALSPSLHSPVARSRFRRRSSSRPPTGCISSACRRVRRSRS